MVEDGGQNVAFRALGMGNAQIVRVDTGKGEKSQRQGKASYPQHSQFPKSSLF